MRYLFILLLSIGLLSCQNNTKNSSASADSTSTETDSLSYKLITFNKVPDDLKDKPDSLKIAYVKAVYPQFEEPQKALNNWIMQHLASAPMSEKAAPRENLEIAAVHFLKEFEDFKKEYPESPAGYAWDQVLQVKHQDEDQINFVYTIYAYTGGAHGLSTTLFLNWDKKLQREIKLDDILISGYQTNLTAAAEKIFRKDEGLKEKEPLDRYFFENQKFAINQNFLITEKGLKFLYNPYEIKSYAEGSTELFIPYSEIKDLIKPKSIISKYIN